MQEVTQKAAANRPQETYQEKKQALAKTYHEQLEQLESQREVEPAAKPTEPEHSPRNKYDNPKIGMAHDTKYEMGFVRPYTQKQWDLVLDSGILGDDEISAVTSSPMNKHLVTRVEFMPHSRQSLSPGPRQTEPDPTKAIHTNALLLRESGDRDDANEAADAEQPSPKPPAPSSNRP